MPTSINGYYGRLRKLTEDIIVSNNSGRILTKQSGFHEAIGLITACGRQGRKLIFIGNGASASIASHMSADFWKNGKIKAISFNDAALLTCVSNDFGYVEVFKKPIEMFADSGDILVAISSSGRSENIIRGARAAKSKECNIITLSGFNKNNTLRSLGDINFYVPYFAYGQVEVIHHSICHCILDTIVSKRKT